MADDEDHSERLDRELIELLNELRVALPGVQVLFGFLLTVPFSQGWSRVTATERRVFFVTFLCTAIATALLIAPSAQHRILWRAQDKEGCCLRTRANTSRARRHRLPGGGRAPAAVWVVTDMIYGRFAVPLIRRARGLAGRSITPGWSSCPRAGSTARRCARPASSARCGPVIGPAPRRQQR